MKGVEPSSSTWKEVALAVELHPHETFQALLRTELYFNLAPENCPVLFAFSTGASPRTRTGTFGFSVRRTHLLYERGFLFGAPYRIRTGVLAVRGRYPRPLDGTFVVGASYRIRTGVPAVKGRCPRPLDE